MTPKVAGASTNRQCSLLLFDRTRGGQANHLPVVANARLRCEYGDRRRQNRKSAGEMRYRGKTRAVGDHAIV